MSLKSQESVQGISPKVCSFSSRPTMVCVFPGNEKKKKKNSLSKFGHDDVLNNTYEVFKTCTVY